MTFLSAQKKKKNCQINLLVSSDILKLEKLCSIYCGGFNYRRMNMSVISLLVLCTDLFTVIFPASSKGVITAW